MKNLKINPFDKYFSKLLESILIDPQISERKKENARQNSNDRYHAKKLAKELSVELTIGKDDAGWNCWIEYHVSQVGPEGLDDELFCTSWRDVRDRLEIIKQKREYLKMTPEDQHQVDLEEQRLEEERYKKLKMRILQRKLKN